jgi:hypothetical protein
MYQILLEGKQLKRNQITGMHLMVGFLLIGIGMVTWLVPDSVKQTALQFLNYVGLIYAIVGFIIVIICIFFNKKIIQTKANSTLRILEIIALLIVLSFSVYKKWYLPVGYSGSGLIAILLAYYLEKNNKKDKKATFGENGIHVPGLGKHTNAPWEEIKNIILKHNILTIDFMNNKLYQAKLSKSNSVINYDAFNAYTKDKIDSNRHKYREDW